MIIKIKQDQLTSTETNIHQNPSLITDCSILAEVDVSAEQNKINLKDLHSSFQ